MSATPRNGLEQSPRTLLVSAASINGIPIHTPPQILISVLVTFADGSIYATAAEAGVTLDAATQLYIRPTANQVQPVGFLVNGRAAPSDDAKTDRFDFYGSTLMWKEEGGAVVGLVPAEGDWRGWHLRGVLGYVEYVSSRIRFAGCQVDERVGSGDGNELAR